MRKIATTINDIVGIWKISWNSCNQIDRILQNTLD